MADTSAIQEYLQIIESAIYGEDMRQAIHDAIERCYMDGDGNSVDLTAREAMTLLNARLDVLVAGLSSDAMTTTDFTYPSNVAADANNTPTAVRIGSVVQLTGRVKLTADIKITDYGDYPTLFTLKEGWLPIADYMYTAQRFSAEYGIFLSNNGAVKVNRYNIGDNATFPYTIPKNTVLAVTLVYLCDDDTGSATPSSTGEIEDARIANDGTIYESLGAHIRSISVGGASDYTALEARVSTDENNLSALTSRVTALENEEPEEYMLISETEINTVLAEPEDPTVDDE